MLTANPSYTMYGVQQRPTGGPTQTCRNVQMPAYSQESPSIACPEQNEDRTDGYKAAKGNNQPPLCSDPLLAFFPISCTSPTSASAPLVSFSTMAQISAVAHLADAAYSWAHISFAKRPFALQLHPFRFFAFCSLG